MRKAFRLRLQFLPWQRRQLLRDRHRWHGKSAHSPREPHLGCKKNKMNSVLHSSFICGYRQISTSTSCQFSHICTEQASPMQFSHFKMTISLHPPPKPPSLITGAIRRGSGEPWIGGKAYLVVDDDVNAAVRRVERKIGKMERFKDDALTGKGGVAVEQDRHHLRGKKDFVWRWQWVETVWNRRVQSKDRNRFPMSSGASEWASEASSAEQANKWAVWANERADGRVAITIIPISRSFESLWIKAISKEKKEFNMSLLVDCI